MAKDDEKKPTAAEKGKGKAPVNGDAEKDAKTGKDGKVEDDKKGVATATEELSEEDQQLKSELDMLVERILESDKSLYKPALDQIKDFIKTSTSSMTAVPKPLKFLRPHYESLEKQYASWPEGENKQSFADMLSVLGMTYSDEERLDCLKYRLQAPSTDLGSWGHEYMRHLALEIGREYQNRLNEDKSTDDITDLASNLVPFFLKHNAEADAVDILSELEMIDQIEQYIDENTYARVCLYMVSNVPLLTYPDNDKFLRTVYQVYRKYKQYTQAVALAIRLNDRDLIEEVFNSTKDKAIRRQMAFLIARQRIWLDVSEDDDPELQDCMNNTRLPDYYKALGKELNILDPKTPDDIYKTHLESSRTAGLTNTDSARHNLASAFVNAFVNTGYGNDTLMLNAEAKSSWVWKTKEEGMLSTTASLGMLLLWDVETGLDKIDPYTGVDDNTVKAGAMLATGIFNTGVRLDSDPALALLGDEDNISSKDRQIRLASIMGLGLAYAGSNKEELLEVLLPIVSDTSLDMQLSAMAALSLGMIFVGSANGEVTAALMNTLLDEDRSKQLKDKWTRFMALGLALLFFGQQEEVDVILETLKALDHPAAKSASVLTEVCAWAGTGAVLKIQQLLHICNEHIEDESEEKKGDELLQSYAVIGLSLVAMGEDVGQDMILRTLGHLMHYGEANIRKAVPLALGLISPSNPQMKVYDTLSRYSHDNDNDVAINAIFAMGLCGAGTNNARLAQLLRQLASYYHRDPNALFMVRIAQGLLHMGKGTLTVSPFHTDRQVLSRVAAAGLLTVLVSLIDAKSFIAGDSHYLLYYLATAMAPRFLITLDEDLQPLTVNVRVGQAVDIVGQAGRPKTITGWQTQSTPVLLAHGERAELEDEKYLSLTNVLEGVVILRKNPEWED
ncbi:26S proteasome regulatory subunit RPN1 [Parastagonospora nodorum]|uniref:26S proteasome regulatory subunit RPN1 n=1 Tax=Phaeosphaeria nodorum (strain SN15 / ATCC MYA-4574 / FGSC 10173) TaxID=321614 RepID=A0A7U2HYZ3_PHANO|nr:26S proteasome regulatory subunit RPN1 [Parastagonospora nodorum]QRC97095.1 26S proteasome regulatory subunit RPN1 [Parastagonospora nodorum SN15]KAH3921308.1 26S proteasome regulatory subunit RPN1 [Parastagonospora nodorum]KAH3944485.1 26S proteasome regulatory subunit RPN1 [Parastagonospora nodorum]KAH3959364.1 26S proteasome regulatory subunit RPN1 [Parastagonospora nodorum]